MPSGSIPASALPSAARSLADDVRGRSDDELTRLLQCRPDLARPAPADLTSMAARAGTRASVLRALDALDQGRLQVLEAVVVDGGPVDRDRLTTLLGASAEDGPPSEAVDEALHGLWELAVLWRSPEGLRPVRTVVEVLGAGLGGLGPSWADLRGPGQVSTGQGAPGQVEPAPGRPGNDWQGSVEHEADPVVAVRALLEQAPEVARSVLERLTWGPPVATVAAEAPAARHEGAPEPLHEALGWLERHGLLVATGPGRVTLPREVALVLRGGRLHRGVTLNPPSLVGRRWDPAAVDGAAGAQVSDLLVHVDELAAAWGTRPPRVLRAGGLAVRDLKLLATTLDVDTDRAAFVAELALAAGLVADDGGLEPVWAPTPSYDEWQHQTGSMQWAALASAWSQSTRAAHLVGQVPPGGTGTINALGPEAHWPPERSLRHDILDELDGAPEGLAPEPEAVLEALRWRRPRRLPREAPGIVDAVLKEAEWLGVTGRGALSRAGRRLVEGAEAAQLAAAISAHLPAPVDQVLLQADLTAVAPGPLVGSLAQFMRMVADVESRGGATVYRFSERSVRRCLDAGWTADDVLQALLDASATPVPQPLDYLVRDAARRHGQTRVGSVACYLRSDDAANLETILAERSLAPLQLRRVAPTVLVSPVQATTVLELLREQGFAPVIESSTGGVVIPPVDRRRSSNRRRPSEPTLHVLDDELTESLVAALRAGEDAAAYERRRQSSRPGPQLPSTDPTTAMGLLREAAADRQGVWIGYSNGQGQVRRMLFYPERVEGGRVTGTSDGATRTLSIHRITGASVR